MHLLLQDASGSSRRLDFQGDTVTVGRDPGCDVVIPEDFVSKTHLRILRGVVLIDLSTNGTFVDGALIGKQGVVLGDRAAQIGRSAITLQVEPEPAAVPGTAVRSYVAPDVAAVPPPDSGRVEQQLREELEELRRQLAESRATPAPPVVDVGRMTAELDSLRATNAKLQARVTESESAPPEPVEPPPDSSAISLLVFKLQRENAQLKKDLAASKKAAPSPATPAAPAASAAPPPAAPAPTRPRLVRPLPAIPGEPAAPAPGAAAGPVGGGLIPLAKDAAPPPAASSCPAGSGLDSVGAGGAAAPSSGSMARLLDLIGRDVEAVPTQVDEPLDTFLVVEGYRLLRRMERVITRIAGDLIQLYQLHTMVPGVEGSLRDLVGGAIHNPAARPDREALLEYFRELGRWMVVAVGSYRKAAETLVEELRIELSAERLAEAASIPAKKRASGKADAELWKRACEHLRGLNPDAVQERLTSIARKVSEDMIQNEADEAFS